MKLIEAIIQPAKLEAVKEALADVDIHRLTVMDVQGYGRQRGHTEVFRGHEYTVNLVRKVMLQLAVDDEHVDKAVEAITTSGRTGAEGKVGDGKIFVLPMDEVVRIRTGERGPEAL